MLEELTVWKSMMMVSRDSSSFSKNNDKLNYLMHIVRHVAACNSHSLNAVNSVNLNCVPLSKVKFPWLDWVSTISTNLSVHPWCEVNTQEGETRVRHWVNVSADQSAN